MEPRRVPFIARPVFYHSYDDSNHPEPCQTQQELHRAMQAAIRSCPPHGDWTEQDLAMPAYSSLTGTEASQTLHNQPIYGYNPSCQDRSNPVFVFNPRANFNMNSTSNTQPCVKCGKPAENVCKNCCDVAGFDNICSTECNVADWDRHKHVCKLLNARRTTYRVGEILQEVFYVYRKKMFDTPICSIEKKQHFNYERVYIEEAGCYKPMLKDIDHLHPFPEHLFVDNEAGEEYKQALLVHLASPVFVTWMHEMLVYFLTDFGFGMSEQSVVPTQRRDLVSVDIQGKVGRSVYNHYIYVITLKDGHGVYAFDLCGATYGFDQSVDDYDNYQKFRGRPNLPASNYGSADSMRAKTLASLGMSNGTGALARLNHYVGGNLVGDTRKWEREYGTNVADLLQLPRYKFELRKDELVHYLSYMIQRHIDEVGSFSNGDKSGKGGFKLNPDSKSFCEK
ncbi:hypothetical protein MBM_04504 [Drepanopeziza brunnea f. sp. 'multigermtubi' MB_m1]|uniref:MYND-type domain-containing protein n=1 Tax=Marssonina brunnea f. sp. multigermtubi (strain MB_m1) TaxID=1072389 RepID=K1WWM9_MARBU|nr:uncharacterized protein MBM_04504 [Drepanopeziza brunnea f. sp. 'multigermtubi' MB_m1]EKD16927.1 hypothetical protein MBM_04504 [Drepanopeziza brunnea f. sp. 'multigermtubi' MB_m1]